MSARTNLNLLRENSDCKIAIDGPAASGKTQVGRALARELGLCFFDTGLTYRATARLALDGDVSGDDAAALAEIARGLTLSARRAADLTEIAVVGFDAADLRRDEISDKASEVSQHRAVRTALVEKQRAALQQVGGAVAVGRDIGAVVMRAEADLKIYLQVSPAVSAARRYKQGAAADDYAATLATLNARNRRDERRAVSPLRPAAGAVVIDTDRLTQTEVVAAALAHVKSIPRR